MADISITSIKRCRNNDFLYQCIFYYIFDIHLVCFASYSILLIIDFRMRDEFRKDLRKISLHHMETCQWTYAANPLPGFCMMRTFIIK